MNQLQFLMTLTSVVSRSTRLPWWIYSPQRDQAQELCCHLFKKARAKFKSRTSLWENIRGLFKHYLINSWDDLLQGIAHGFKDVALNPNTS